MLLKIDIKEKIINDYYNILLEINKITLNYNFKIYEISDDKLREQIDDNIYGKFIISGIKEEIFHMKYRYVILFEGNVIYLLNDSPIYDSNKILQLLKIIKYLQKKGNGLKLTAYFYNTLSSRILIDDCFNARAVNGGYTSFGDKRKMVVWRKEDGIKVFIHELIHYFEIDSDFRHYHDVNNYHNIDITTNQDLAFEAFTDFYAINYYIVYLSLISTINKQIFYNNFVNQYNFTLHQGFKIIKYSKIDKGESIKNATNVYSYYLLKLYLMIYHRNDILENININKLIKSSYNFVTNKIISKYIRKIKLDNKLNMALKQIYL